MQGFHRPIRVLAVNRNRILREGLSVLIGTQPGLELVASVAAPDLALNIFARERPDLTLMDLDLPSDSGIQAIVHIRKMDPGAWVIAMVTDDTGGSGTRAMKAGAAAVMAKDLIGEMLPPLILSHQRAAAS